MAINRFDKPVLSEYVSQYVPYPFEDMLRMGAYIQKDYEDTEKDLQTVDKVGTMNAIFGDVADRDKIFKEYKDKSRQIVDKYGGKVTDLQFKRDWNDLKQTMLQDTRIKGIGQTYTNYEQYVKDKQKYVEAHGNLMGWNDLSPIDQYKYKTITEEGTVNPYTFAGFRKGTDWNVPIEKLMDDVKDIGFEFDADTGLFKHTKTGETGITKEQLLGGKVVGKDGKVLYEGPGLAPRYTEFMATYGDEFSDMAKYYRVDSKELFVKMLTDASQERIHKSTKFGYTDELPEEMWQEESKKRVDTYEKPVDALSVSINTDIKKYGTGTTSSDGVNVPQNTINSMKTNFRNLMPVFTQVLKSDSGGTKTQKLLGVLNKYGFNVKDLNELDKLTQSDEFYRTMANNGNFSGLKNALEGAGIDPSYAGTIQGIVEAGAEQYRNSTALVTKTIDDATAQLPSYNSSNPGENWKTSVKGAVSNFNSDEKLVWAKVVQNQPLSKQEESVLAKINKKFQDAGVPNDDIEMVGSTPFYKNAADLYTDNFNNAYKKNVEGTNVTMTYTNNVTPSEKKLLEDGVIANVSNGSLIAKDVKTGQTVKDLNLEKVTYHGASGQRDPVTGKTRFLYTDKNGKPFYVDNFDDSGIVTTIQERIYGDKQVYEQVSQYQNKLNNLKIITSVDNPTPNNSVVPYIDPISQTKLGQFERFQDQTGADKILFRYQGEEGFGKFVEGIGNAGETGWANNGTRKQGYVLIDPENFPALMKTLLQMGGRTVGEITK